MVGFRDPMYLCTSVSEEGGDGEDAVSETPSLLSYTLKYVSLVELGTLYRVGLRDPMYLCTSVSEEGGDGEDADSEAPSLLSYRGSADRPVLCLFTVLSFHTNQNTFSLLKKTNIHTTLQLE